MPSDSTQEGSTDRSQAGENHITNESSAARSQESVDTAALFLLNVFAPGVVISSSASTATTAAVSSFVVLVVIALIVVVFAAAVDGLILF